MRACRAKLLRFLAELGAATLLVVEEAQRWRAAGGNWSTAIRMRRHSTTGRLQAGAELFQHKSANYLTRILVDLERLPVPAASDPFLRRWLGEDQRWWIDEEAVPPEMLDEYAHQLRAHSLLTRHRRRGRCGRC